MTKLPAGATTGATDDGKNDGQPKALDSPRNDGSGAPLPLMVPVVFPTKGADEIFEQGFQKQNQPIYRCDVAQFDDYRPFLVEFDKDARSAQMKLQDQISRRLQVNIGAAFGSCDVVTGDPCGYEGLFVVTPFREVEGDTCICFNAADEHPNQPFFEIDTTIREASCCELELDARTVAEKEKAEQEAASVKPPGTQD